jgi:acyl-CoA reductase-like NAD-dependent aldehyde dehydrogenase
MANEPIRMKYFVNNEFHESETKQYMDCYDPSTGEVTHRAPQCTQREVESAIEAAKAAYPAWADTPPNQRVQVLFKLKALLDKNLDELTRIVAASEGKKWDEAMGDVLKVTEVVEYACAIPHLLKGDSIMNISRGRLRRNRALEFSVDDTDGLDGALVHRNRQYIRSQSRQLRSPGCDAHRGAVGRSRTSARGVEHHHRRPE